MDKERIHELAVLQATTGLQGADLLEFEQWWTGAPEDARAHYRETIDLISMITVSDQSAAEAPAHLKGNVMTRIDDLASQEAKVSTPPKEEAIPGYSYILHDEGEWKELPTRGTRIKELSSSKSSSTVTFLLEMDPGSRLLSHHHEGAEEAYVLHGDLQMRGKTLHAGDHMRAEPGTVHKDLFSQGGCRALIITAHENYPKRSIHAFDKLSRWWSQCKTAISGS